MKKILFIALMLSLVIGGYLIFTTVDSKTPVAVAGKTYSGTLYVAGMGGHFAVADVTIDPSNTEQPIKVKDLGMLSIGTGKTHPTHDARIDSNDKNTMFWSTYKLDGGNLHVGKSDLKTGKVIQDVALKNPDRAAWTGANFCGSGQSKTSFIPVSMSNEGYIDVYDKKTMKLKHRLWVGDLGNDIKCGVGEYTFAHGTNTPDMKAFLLTLNQTPDGHTKWTGNTELVLLDMAALEQGKFKVLAKNTITGTAGKTITFRQYFSQDGKHFFQSGADRGYLIDAKTLKVLDEITPLPGENHDIMPTPDGKYAVMTLREKIKDKDGKEIVDGTVLLYDVEARKTIGKTASVCYDCHKNVGQGMAVLCGLDANWK
ncbi:MAG: hypothetical protein AB1632_07175 [Nitrospirota bacterium]